MEQEEITSKPIASTGDKDFLQFITEEGWEYLSPCGCQAQMNKYINKAEKYKDYEIWLNKEKTIYEIHRISDRISLRIATASALYYGKVYNDYLQK